MGTNNSQFFPEFLSLLEKYGQTEVFQQKDQKSSQDSAFIALLRIFFGRMLLSWGIVRDPNRPPKTFQTFFPERLPKEINDSFMRYKFGRSSQTNQDTTLLYPEIFCKLYETYLDVKRHSTGSFYTPDFLTEFMSQENIDRIFLDHFRQVNPGLHIATVDAISTLPADQQEEVQGSVGYFVTKIKICDPACGTGRFLIAVARYLETLFLHIACPENGLSRLASKFASVPDFRSYLRRFILEHCIYGVEKDPTAAEICRLRLLAWFLEVIPADNCVDETTLPDLDHIKVGNSLIGLSGISSIPTELQKSFNTRVRITSKLRITAREKRRILLRKKITLLDGELRSNFNKKLLAEYTSQGFEITESSLSEMMVFHWLFEFGCRFTLLIGNPPYGNILSKSEKDILRKKDTAVDEVYINFLLRILRDEIPFEYSSFLTPKSYLIRQNYLDFRQALLSSSCPYSIYEIGSKKFKGALNEVQVLSFHRDPTYSSQLTIGSIGTPPSMIYDIRGQSTTLPLIDDLNVCRNAQCTGLQGSAQFELYTRNTKCPACGQPAVPLNRIRLKLNPRIYPLIEQIEKMGDLNSLNPRDFPDLKRGEEDQGLKRVKATLQPYDPKLCAFITAKNDFSPFFLRPQKSFELTQVQTQKTPRFYATGPKLLIKHNSIVPEAVFTRDAYCFTAAIYSLLHPDEKTLKYLCGLLNSTLMQFYCIFGINNQNLVTMNLNQYMIRHLPIISLATAGPISNAIVGFVDQILAETMKSGDKLDMKPLPEVQELNQAIYTLYGISTQDSIDLIEKSVQESLQIFSKTRIKK